MRAPNPTTTITTGRVILRQRLLALAASTGMLAACTGAPDAAPLPAEATTERLAYGEQRDQWVDLSVPGGEGPFGVVVLLHGGYWYEQFQADLMAALVSDVVRRGYAAANVEYRRVDGAGGWPMTFEDVGAAIDLLVKADPRLDLDRVVVVGHSAGGQLALWSAARDQLPPSAPGANPVVEPCAVVGQSPVADLAEAALLGLGGNAAQNLLGGSPEEVGDRYDLADPARLLPLGVPTLIVHGRADGIVPSSMSVSFVDAADAAGDDITYLPVDGDHFVVLDPGNVQWTQTMDWLTANCLAV